MTKQTGIIGTLRAKGSRTVEYVKKCTICGATLIVQANELSKDRHDMCGWGR
jgi:hypothetical protein